MASEAEENFSSPELYCTLIYPYINYGLMSWGTACQSRLQVIKTKQNKCVRSIFFAKKRENADPYYKLLDILNLENTFNFKISTLVHKIKYDKTNIPEPFIELIPSASEIHNYNTRYASNSNLHRPASS